MFQARNDSPVEFVLTDPQYELVTSPHAYPAFVGGFGSGKTQALIKRALVKKLENPRQANAYYMPTFDLVHRVAFPRFAEALEESRLRFQINKSYMTIEVEKNQLGMFIFRTMDNPARIIGYEVADSEVDELDTLAMDDARDAWNKILGRNRQKKTQTAGKNTIAVGTTPEGYRFVYERWKRMGKIEDGYHLIKASTESNARNLPEGYVDSLRSTYPTNLLAAYLDGDFVNLTSGSVYPSFDRLLNGTTALHRPGEIVHVGMDFNVGNMAATVHVIRAGEPYAVAEHAGILDTPAMIRALKMCYPGCMVIVYPDSSGKNRKSSEASVSDISLLRQARMNVIVNTQNPAVKDRVLALHAIIESRRYKVNSDTCPLLTEALEKQAYNKNGEPDKGSGFDHLNDASGYFAVQKWPIRSLGMKRLRLSGV